MTIIRFAQALSTAEYTEEGLDICYNSRSHLLPEHTFIIQRNHYHELAHLFLSIECFVCKYIVIFNTTEKP